MADHEPMEDVACSEPELSAELRDALTLLRDQSDNEDFRILADDVLAGKCSLFDASGTAAFSDVVFARIAQEFGELGEDEKRSFTARTGSAGVAASCDSPCAGCPGMCAISGTNPPG